MVRKSVIPFHTILLLVYFVFQRLRSTLKENKQLAQDLVQPTKTHIYTCVLCIHTRIHTCRDFFHLDFTVSLGISSRPLSSHQSTPHAVCVCVCVYKHIHPHTLQLPSKMEVFSVQTTSLSFLMSKVNSTPATNDLHRLVEPPHSHPPMLRTNCTYIHPAERMFTNIYISIRNTSLATHLCMHQYSRHGSSACHAYHNK